MKITNEAWVPIKGHEVYQISSSGRVRMYKIRTAHTDKKGELLIRDKAIHLNNKGYKYVTLDKNKKFLIHRLLAIAFIPNLENKPNINHIDGNRLNNSLDNLEWCTQQENMMHAHATGLNPGRNKAVLCLTNGMVYKSLKCAALTLKINHGNMSAHLRGVRKSVSGFKFQYQ